ncbi:PREDICTED: phosphatidylinositol N-acetylglucosaminyltransferase subunit H [Nanorana parkeri]|uniref:phosphatidylinositol N-acetylglucosaminyltransferase subunit H n=1 Tax=Nanorana parkeri TaxID=125878 RepID=UPI00085404D2|nr:PREDICTED: phosphatidylinositol N-acetylglucosaminyltransferase subunit H [Nanorana parkeri]
MEGTVYSDIHGDEVGLQQSSYSDTCREFTVTRSKLSLRSLTGCTCAVWLAAYGIFLVTEHNAVLSAAILCTILGLLLHLHLVKIDQESLLLLGSLGIQKSVTYASGRESTVFLEMCRVQDVVINEAISMSKVHYHLCILLRDPADPKGPSQVVPVFQGSQPRLDCLVEIYRSCQEILSKRNQPGCR